MNLVYLVGVPGSGKSTLMAALTAHLRPLQMTQPLGHVRYAGAPVIQLGVMRTMFPGTDGLSMSVQPRAAAFIDGLAEGRLAELVLGEGDRLATQSFLLGCARAAAVHVLYVHVSEQVAARRREQRSLAAGTSLQNETWLTGRYTKVANLLHILKTNDIPITKVEAGQPVDELVRSLRSLPPLAPLWEGTVSEDTIGHSSPISDGGSRRRGT